MLKNKEYIYLYISSIICCILQYYILAGTHKVGRENWPYVFASSLISFLIINFIYSNVNGKILRIILLTVMFSIPFIVYTLIEWLYFPLSLLNTINDNAAFYFGSVTFLSGGWIFSISLILNSNYRKKLDEHSSYKN
ncbi:TPA_asm: hypothetical protein GND15_003754 [Salmonella enterica subsp. salamae serovar 58:d:z6]|uniref:Inner membrane protein n=1 Tax=Salmonella enterica subsp. salamae serovar 58:d:z6 TaxID=41517 RepID=A0A728XQF4_SALER|nr:hypothetical protein [Salmonella enterica]EBQ4853605.1 hypothetical protein [Salmonella enterica subsp. salamae]ECG1422659.1 hypothetical protein [Salmonella enterica subsp. salamae str. CFSAN000559]EAX2627639.1 hypothetical protein [Salmonella enterica]EBO9260915.1 hypothetical protein [Salmonella enterica]ECC1646820.1 hypothetical protein [Salmonella enterica subsp. salamae]